MKARLLKLFQLIFTFRVVRHGPWLSSRVSRLQFTSWLAGIQQRQENRDEPGTGNSCAADLSGPVVCPPDGVADARHRTQIAGEVSRKNRASGNAAVLRCGSAGSKVALAPCSGRARLVGLFPAA